MADQWTLRVDAKVTLSEEFLQQGADAQEVRTPASGPRDDSRRGQGVQGGGSRAEGRVRRDPGASDRAGGGERGDERARG